MFVLYLGLVGLLAFTIGVGILGFWLRKQPTKDNAEKFSRVMHILFIAGLVAPAVIVLVYPGLTQLDGVVGLTSFPSSSIIRIRNPEECRIIRYYYVVAIHKYYYVRASRKIYI